MHTFVLFNVNICLEMEGNKNISVKKCFMAFQFYAHKFMAATVQVMLDKEKVVVKEVEVEMEVVVIQ